MRHLRQIVFIVAAALASARMHGGNLIVGGDFGEASTNLAPLCAGSWTSALSLFTEPQTWNRCGRCEIVRAYPDDKHPGETVNSASVSIGCGDDGRPGFVVEPDAKYDFSFDVRGSVKRIGVKLVYWIGDDDRKDRREADVDLADNSASRSWSVKKGSFTAPKDARRAALRLFVWSSSKWKDSPQLKVGDFFLFDNVSVVRSRHNLDTGDSAAEAAPAIRLRKTIAPSDSFSDLVSYKDGRTPASAKTLFSIALDNDSLLVSVTADEPDGPVSTGTVSRVWSGDAIELVFFGGKDGRSKTHVAFNPAGAKYTAGSEKISNDGWTLETSISGVVWRATARLPFAFLGLDGTETEIPFNVGRARPKARAFDVWSANGSFHDADAAGRLAINGYAALLKREFGIAADIPDRAAFDARYAAEAEARLAAKMARFRESTFSVASVPAVSDWTLPYLPDEIFDPPESISIKAAVNEIRALPLAIANLTGRAEDYRVVLETAANDFVGDFGLAGFPPENVVVRVGVRFRDAEGDSPSLRFDPLPRIGEAGVVTIPPREAGLIWIDFDCTDVAPGTYNGRLRVIPLCESGKCRSKDGRMDYAGKMRTIPVSLEVVNAVIPSRSPIPAGYFLPVESQESLDLAFQIGCEYFQIHSWHFKFERDGNGDPDLTRPTGATTNIAKTVAAHAAWAKKHGFTPKFSIVYSAMDACKGIYGCGNDPGKFRRFWPQYVRGVKTVMNAAGVPDSDYFIEVKDEPKPEILAELLEAHKLAKEAAPTVRLAMLLASWELPLDTLEEFVPYADVWILWRGKFANAAFGGFVQRLQEASKEIAHYSCDTSIRLPLLSYYRHHAWFGALHGLDAAFMYQLTDHVGGAGFGYKDFKAIPVAGLFYRSFGTPVPSLRLMALREGFTDVKFLAALKEASKGKTDAEVSAFLATAAEEVVVRHAGDAALPDKLRDRARELLVKVNSEP